jgi:hypothetical protein
MAPTTQHLETRGQSCPGGVSRLLEWSARLTSSNAQAMIHLKRYTSVQELESVSITLTCCLDSANVQLAV